MPKWARVTTEPTKNSTQSLWQFTDEKGEMWKGVVWVEPVNGKASRFTLSVKIERNPAVARQASWSEGRKEDMVRHNRFTIAAGLLIAVANGLRYEALVEVHSCQSSGFNQSTFCGEQVAAINALR